MMAVVAESNMKQQHEAAAKASKSISSSNGNITLYSNMCSSYSYLYICNNPVAQDACTL